jgi:hypothetical protein
VVPSPGSRQNDDRSGDLRSPTWARPGVKIAAQLSDHVPRAAAGWRPRRDPVSVVVAMMVVMTAASGLLVPPVLRSLVCRTAPGGSRALRWIDRTEWGACDGTG